MDYSSTKKTRLPGISFGDFDCSSDSSSDNGSYVSCDDGDGYSQDDNDNDNAMAECGGGGGDEFVVVDVNAAGWGEQSPATANNANAQDVNGESSFDSHDYREDATPIKYDGFASYRYNTNNNDGATATPQQEGGGDDAKLATPKHTLSTPSPHTTTTAQPRPSTSKKQRIRNKSSSKKKSSKKQKESKSILSPTTARLHETAHQLINSTPVSTLDKVDDLVVGVVDNLEGGWRRLALATSFGAVGKKKLEEESHCESQLPGRDVETSASASASGTGTIKGKSLGVGSLTLALDNGDKEEREHHVHPESSSMGGNDSDSDSEDYNAAKEQHEQQQQGGEQTAVLDAAAAYLERMKNQYQCTPDNDNDDMNMDEKNGKGCEHSNDIDTQGEKLDATNNGMNNDPVVKNIKHKDDPIVNIGNSQISPIPKSQAPEQLPSSSPDKSLNDSTNSNDEYDMAEESFYIGPNEGFCSSNSVHESDISETASEGEGDDEEENEDGELLIQGDVEDSLALDLDDTRGEEEEESILNETLVEEESVNANKEEGVGGEQQVVPHTSCEEKVNGCVPEVIAEELQAESSASASATAGFSASASSPKRDEMDGLQHLSSPSSPISQTDGCPPENNSDEDGAMSPTPITTPCKQQPQEQEDPNNTSILTDDGSQSYVPSSLKDIFSQQESQLSQMLSSIDALSSTPGRIAKNYEAELLSGEDDADDPDVGTIDFGAMKMKGLTPVKKQLMLSPLPSAGMGKSPVKRMEPLAEEEDGVEEDDEVQLPQLREMSSPEQQQQSQPVEQQGEVVDAVQVKVHAALPQSPIANDNMEYQHPANNAGLEEHNNMGPKEEMVALNNNEAMANTPAAPSMENEAVVLPQQPEDDRNIEEAHCNEPSTPTNNIKQQGKANDFISVPSAGEQKAEEKNDSSEQSPPEQPNDPGANETEDIDEEDDIPDSMLQLFRDADVELQNALSSPTLNDGKPRNEGAISLCDGYTKSSTTNVPSPNKAEEDESRRLADAKAAEERLEKERLADEEEAFAEKARLAAIAAAAAAAEQAESRRLENERLAKAEAQRVDMERLATEEAAAKQAELDRLENERTNRERTLSDAEDDDEEEGIPDSMLQLFRDADDQLQDVLASPTLNGGMPRNTCSDDYTEPTSTVVSSPKKSVEDDAPRQLAKAKAAEECLEKERIAAEEAATKQAELDGIESERIENEWAVAAQRQKEEEERLEKERLAGEAAKQTELDTLESERIENERAMAVQRQREEEERLEKERLAAEAAKQAELVRLESERIENERAVAAQRLKEEEEAAKAEAERAEIERLAAEEAAAEQAELDRLERETEHEKALAAQKQQEEEARLLVEAKAERERIEMERLEIEADKHAELNRLEAERIEKEKLTGNNQKEDEASEPTLDSLRGAFLAAESKLQSAVVLPQLVSSNTNSLPANIAGANVDTPSVDLTVNETFDTALCTLGGTDKALDDFFDAKENADESIIDDALEKQPVDATPQVERVTEANIDLNGVHDRAAALETVDVHVESNEVFHDVEESVDKQESDQAPIAYSPQADISNDESMKDIGEESAHQVSTEIASEQTEAAAAEPAKEEATVDTCAGDDATALEVEEKKVDDAMDTSRISLGQPLQSSYGGEKEDIDVLDKVSSYLNRLASTHDTATRAFEDSVGNQLDEEQKDGNAESEKCVEPSEIVAEEQKQPAGTSDSRPSSGGSGSEVLDESTMNESMFMPNISTDVLSNNSPDSKDSLPDAASGPVDQLAPMSEDESCSDSSDDEAFFPNRNKTRRSIAATVDKSKKPSTKASAPEDITNAGSAKDASKSKAIEPTRLSTPSSRLSLAGVAEAKGVQKPALTSKPNGRERSLSSTRPTIDRSVSMRTKRAASARARSYPPSPCEEQPRKLSAATLKRRNRLSAAPDASVPKKNNRKAAPLWSPPSTMKPAKKRTKNATPLKEESKVSPSKSTNAAAEPVQSPVATPIQNDDPAPSQPPANSKPSMRQMRSETDRSMLVTRGKENNKVEATAGKSMDASSKSMRQSLVMMTRSRREQSKSSKLQEASQGKDSKKKKKADMKRLERLAQPRSQSMANRTQRPSPVKAKAKGAKATGPPSLLSRASTAHRYSVKSTVELEEEEMERIKARPFKAQRIRGSSIDVQSRFKARRQVPSAQKDMKPVHKHPSANTSKPPYLLNRQSQIYKPTPTRKKVHTFGEMQQHYLNHGLRDCPLPNMSPKKESLTTPKPPSFLRRQTLSHHTHSATPSSEEIELKECKKQFRARPLPSLGTRSTRSHARRQTVQHQRQAEKPRTITTPSPFRLHTNFRAASSRPPPPSSDDIELSKPFRARPNPGSSQTYSDNTPYHLRAQQEYELASERIERRYEDEMATMRDATKFKAAPVPRTTYVPRPAEMPKQAHALTRPKPPRFSLAGRAEERRLYDQHAEELREQQRRQTEMREQEEKEHEEEEIRRLRSSYADEGGCVFKANAISITYQ